MTLTSILSILLSNVSQNQFNFLGIFFTWSIPAFTFLLLFSTLHNFLYARKYIQGMNINFSQKGKTFCSLLSIFFVHTLPLNFSIYFLLYNCVYTCYMNKLFENFIRYIFLIFSQNRHSISCSFNFESSLLFYFLITIKLYWCNLYLLRCVTFHCYIFYLPKATTLKKTDSHSSCQTQRAEGNLGLPPLSNLWIFYTQSLCKS